MDEITLDEFLAYLEKYGVVSCGIRDPLCIPSYVRDVPLPVLKKYLLDPSGYLAAQHGLAKNELFAELIKRVS